jgi:hypothetical protein
VSHPLAGNKWGAIFIPRIGQEVIVDFIGGDPDYPIITGRVYNNEHMPPYELDKYKTYSTIKTHSTMKGSSNDWNELRFVDYKGKEQVFIHANWRMDVRVKWNMYKTVKETYHCQIGKGYYRTVGGDCNIYTYGTRKERADGEMQISAGGSIMVLGESEYKLNAKGNIELYAGREIILEGAMGITLKVGGNFIKIDAAGVSIQGTLVLINSGGAPSSSTSFHFDDPGYAAEADDGTPGYLDKPRPPGTWKPKTRWGGPDWGPPSPPGPPPPVKPPTPPKPPPLPPPKVYPPYPVPTYPTAEAAAVAAMQELNPNSVAENREYGGWIKKNPDGTFSPEPAVRGSEAGLDNMPAKGPDDAVWYHTHGAVVPDGKGGDKFDSENFSGDDGDHGFSKANNAVGYVATPSGAIKKYDPAKAGPGPRDGESTLPDRAPP